MAKDRDSNQNQEAGTLQFSLLKLWDDNRGSESRAGADEENLGRGKVQHVLSGEAASFNDWPALVDLLKGRMFGGDYISQAVRSWGTGDKGATQ
jgi:hypothetical protein